jgi:hypothetical protein
VVLGLDSWFGDFFVLFADMSSSVQIVRDLFQVGSFLFGVIVLYRTRQEDDFANQKLCKKLESIGKKLDAVEQKLLDSDSKLDKIRAGIYLFVQTLYC